jgi:hypothetical protein
MKLHRSLFLAVTLLVSSAAAMAQETNKPATRPNRETNPNRETTREAAEKRKAEAAKLTPEQRAKQRKEAIEKREARIQELRALKAKGPLSDAQSQQLERLQKQSERAAKADDKRSDKPAGKKPRRNPAPVEPATQQ